MARWWLALGAFNALISVAAGAFAAHALKSRLTPDMLGVFETGARYQMYHALGLLAVGLLALQGRRVNAAGWVMLAGIALFCGSLYALALTGVRLLGAITPLGGLCFLAAWLVFGIGALRLSPRAATPSPSSPGDVARSGTLQPASQHTNTGDVE